MTLKNNNQDIIGISKGGVIISSVYKGVTLVWSAIRSCFGIGYWVNTMPWSNADVWRNNK